MHRWGVEWKPGKVMWRVNLEWEGTLTFNGESRKQILGAFCGTLLWVDGRFLWLGELGYPPWLDLTPKGYRQLARAWLFAA